jgi:AcrR family transcriptional regulator
MVVVPLVMALMGLLPRIVVRTAVRFLLKSNVARETDRGPVAILTPVPSETDELPIAADLPVAGQQPRRRADAIRNHERVLCTAARLFAERGPEHVSMDQIATEAGVGKGTLFRAFGDRAGLAAAVLSEHEAGFQDAFLRGPAPLGPGAPPIERIGAFGTAYMHFLDGHIDLMLTAEGGVGTRYKSGPFTMYRVHLGTLVREALPEGFDHDYTTDVLLAPLSADFFVYQRRLRGRSLTELADAYRCLVGRMLTCR